MQTETSSRRTTSASTKRRHLTVGGMLLGMGLGGFVDGVVIHQILQWHHMGTATSGHEAFPNESVASLEDNTLWDGLFHAGTWFLVFAGLLLVWHATDGGRTATWRTLIGLLLAGWGLFNVVEGVVNHQMLGIHHVRDDLGGPLSWDLAFLAFGVVLVIAGLLLRNSNLARNSGA
jgi:uncharacterized membrane protein